MDAGLSIASSALAAATTEISVASENVANAQTLGYVEQRAQLAAQPGGDLLGIGSGVIVNSVAQVSDPLLTANNLQAQSGLSNATALQQVLTGIQNIFPLGQSSAAAQGTASSSNTSISGQLSSFWSSWDAIAQDPSGPAPRTQVVDLAQGLTTSLNEASSQLSQLSANTTAQIGNDVAQVNSLLSQAASLNESIVATSGGGGTPNQLVDQLNNVTNKLASLVGASIQTQQNGSAQISIGGVTVVQNATTSTLAINTATGTITTANGAVAVPVPGGELAGLLTGLNVAIPQYAGQLNAVASNLATLVNGALSQGFTAGGNPGDALFTPNGGTVAGAVTAANIGVNSAVIADPSLIAAASATPPASNPTSTNWYVNDGSNAATIAELASATAGSPDVAYQQLIQNIGSQTQDANSQVAAQTSVAQQAQQSLQAATGVNTDTELTNLMQFQASYQASAKLVSVIDTTIQSLLQAV